MRKQLVAQILGHSLSGSEFGILAAAAIRRFVPSCREDDQPGMRFSRDFSACRNGKWSSSAGLTAIAARISPGQTDFRTGTSKSNRGALDFTYATGGLHFDSFVCDRVWQILHQEIFDEGLFAVSLAKQVREARDRFRASCSENEIPYVRAIGGIRYFTFAGYLVNKAIGLVAQKTGFRADDISLQVSSPVDWSTVPSRPDEFEDVFHLLFEPTSEQSIYQQQLPAALQLQEYLQDWLRDETVLGVLGRLVASTLKLVNAEAIRSLSDPDW